MMGSKLVKQAGFAIAGAMLAMGVGSVTVQAMPVAPELPAIAATSDASAVQTVQYYRPWERERAFRRQEHRREWRRERRYDRWEHRRRNNDWRRRSFY